MKKIIRILTILIVIGAAICGIFMYLKNNGYLTCCNCDGDEYDDFDFENPFTNRDYISIQPKESCEEQSENNNEVISE